MKIKVYTRDNSLHEQAPPIEVEEGVDFVGWDEYGMMDLATKFCDQQFSADNLHLFPLEIIIERPSLIRNVSAVPDAAIVGEVMPPARLCVRVEAWHVLEFECDTPHELKEGE
jgi:hypothetical protein